MLLRRRIEVSHDVCVLHGQVLHGLIAGHAVDRGPVFGFGVVPAEPVYPDKVECIDQHPADGVGCVMAV